MSTLSIDTEESFVGLARLSRQNGRYAAFSLIGMISVFLVSLVFFVRPDLVGFGGNINLQAQAVILEYDIREEKSAITRVKNELELKLADLYSAMGALAAVGSTAAAAASAPSEEAQLSQRRDLEVRISSLLESYPEWRKSTLPMDIEAAAKRVVELAKSESERLSVSIEQQKVRLDELDVRLAPLQQARIKQLEGDSTTELISVGITRVGAVMLSVFMIQIFLSFYRYYTRMSNYFKAKLMIARELSGDDLKELLKTLSPEQISFGAEPAMPYDKMIEMLKLSR